VKIAIAQLNPTVGALERNAAKVDEAAHKAVHAGAEMLVVPELVISGYPPKDLLLRNGFVNACDGMVENLSRRLPANLGVLLGHPTHWHVPERRVANAASLLMDGTVQHTVHKMLLPNYDVFDERRYFRPAERAQPMEFRGRRLGVHICEDAWWGEPDTFYHTDPTNQPDPITELSNGNADVMINLSASPFEAAKPARRLSILRRHIGRHRVPFLFANQVGGNDDLVFDGHSLVVNRAGELVHQLAGFTEDFHVVDIDELPPSPGDPDYVRLEIILDALILGLQDYARKCGFQGCVLGLSGGVDSTLAAYIAARAMGPQNVHALLLPSRFSTEHSLSDARQLAEQLRINYETVPIDEVHKAYEATPVIADDLQSQPGGLADQNLQARIRGAMVMVRSNRHGWLPLATGNKSELAVGYCTLYGDMAGGFAVLADVFKRDVYALCRYINEVREGREVIPQHIITKAPSAELAPDQFDQNELPPYELLDAILEGLIEREESPARLSEQFPRETVEWVARKLDRNEFKRRQMPPGIKLSSRAFGSGRRMPIAARMEYD